ncbi:MAG: lysophospholipid acyltransferase family protein [Acidobacteriota bacterium]
MGRILESLKFSIIALVANLLIRISRYTMRITYINDEVIRLLSREGKNYIMAFWHGRLFMMPYSYPGKRITILISRHRDGEYIARTMRLFGFDSTRGSTTEGGPQALKEVLRRGKQGYDIAFTPDGPRGPGQKAQPGVIQAAKLSGFPIIPVSFSASRKKVFQTWDKFLLPLPFSKGVFLYGDPIHVSRDADDRMMEEKRIELETSLKRITEEVDGYFKSVK